MSSDDEEELLKELSQELDSFEMSPCVSDDELSVAGGGHVVVAPGKRASKEGSMTGPGPRGKRHEPESTRRIIYDVPVKCENGLGGMPGRCCGQNMSLSPPTSSGQMSPTSACTAAASGYGYADTKATSLMEHTKTCIPAHAKLATTVKHGSAGLSDDAGAQVTSTSTAAANPKTHVQSSSARSKRPRVRNRATAMHMAAQPQRPVWRPCAARSALPLPALPPDALHTVLRCLSAQDLTTLGRVSRALRAAAADETLWRRLYYARWGTFCGGEEKIMGAAFWKTTYLERDAADFRAAVLPQEAGLQAAYRSMHLTERAAAVTAATEPSWSLQLASSQEQVAAFLRARGLPQSAAQPADMSDVHLVRFGDVFVDDRSGWLHLCDGTCTLQRPDDAGAFMVCPVTGRMHGRVPETWEGGGCGGGDGGDGREQDADAPIGGWLANVYEAGYCHNEFEDGEIHKCALLALELRATRR